MFYILMISIFLNGINNYSAQVDSSSTALTRKTSLTKDLDDDFDIISENLDDDFVSIEKKEADALTKKRLHEIKLARKSLVGIRYMNDHNLLDLTRATTHLRIIENVYHRKLETKLPEPSETLRRYSCLLDPSFKPDEHLKNLLARAERFFAMIVNLAQIEGIYLKNDKTESGKSSSESLDEAKSST